MNQYKRYFIVFWISLALALLLPARAYAVKLFIIVEGVNIELEKNVLAYLTLEKEKNNETLDEERIQRYFRMGNKEIKEALKPFGYYQPKIQSEIKIEDDEWRIYYNILPGPPVKIVSVDIRIQGAGESEPPIQNEIEKFPLNSDKIAAHNLYEQGKRAIFRAATEQGYLDAKYAKSQLIIDPQNNSAAVHLHLHTGNPYFFGDITFKPVKVRDSLLRRYLQFKKGDRFSGKAVLDLQAALESSGFFSSVSAIADRDNSEDHEIPVNIDLVMNKPNKFDFGVGYGTDTGARGRARWNRRVLGSRGHTFDVEATLSQIKRESRASYYIPWRNPRNDRIELGAGLRNRETDTSQSIERSAGTSIQLKYGNWRETNSIQYEQTDFNVGNEGWRITNLFVLGTNLTQIKIDNYDLVRRGTKFGMGLLGAWDQAWSDISFFRAEINGKLVLGLTKKARALLRGKLGSMTVSNFDLLPPNYRYFTGGDSSIRGYSYESQGPKNELGKVIGGRNIIETSIEFDYPIGDSWRVAAFWDGGNAFNSREDPIIQGAGVGIRYVLPIGMMRVDVAQALSEPDNSWRFHITIGPDL